MKSLEMYHRAEGFYFAMHILKRRTIGEIKAKAKGIAFTEIGPTSLLWAPQFTLLAFSLELYLKALLSRSDISYAKAGHDLEKLFLKLDAVTRLKIKYLYDNAPPLIMAQRAVEAEHGIPPDFDSRLKLSKLAFVEQRYLFEDQHKGSSVLLEDVVSAVRVYILNWHEDWLFSLPPVDLSVPPVNS